MREPTDRDLYDRGAATLLAAWAACATVAVGAALLRRPGVSAAVFPSGSERDVYNNPLLGRDLPGGEAYAAAGVTAFAAWTHESDRPLVRDLERRGYRLAESTRAMGMALNGLGDAAPETGVDLAEPAWPDHVRLIGLAAGFLGAGPPGSHVLVARHDGADAATGLAFDHDGADAAARARASGRRRWPSGCTPRSASATSAAFLEYVR